MMSGDIFYKRSRFSTRLLEDRLYTAGHSWLEREEGDLWRIGFTEFAVRMLGEIVELGFDLTPGSPVETGQVIGWLEGFKAVTDIFSPLSGRFERCNPALDDNITLLTTDPYMKGWLFKPGFPICLPQMAPLYTREPPSARNPVRRTIVQLQRPSPQPTLTWNRPEPLLSGHFSDTAPHLCPFFANLRCTRPRVSLPAPAAPRSSAASRRRAAGSDDLPPAGASSIWRASPAGPQFSPAAAGDSSATSA